MTAINVLCQGARGLMLTDTMGYEINAAAPVFEECRAKAITLPHSLSVIACRGTVHPSVMVYDSCHDFDSYDDLRQRFAEPLRAAWKQANEEERKNGLDVIGMGWSGAHNRVCSFFSASDNDFEMQDGEAHLAPLLTPEEVAAAGVDPHGFANGEHDLLKLMQFQRAQNGCIGGAAVLTIVTQHKILQSVMYRWPDKRGDRVAPETAFVNRRYYAGGEAGIEE
jgi:hypothetical protein